MTPTPDREVVAEAIYQSLMQYRCTYIQIEDDGGPMPLVDVVSPGCASIQQGQDELSELAAHIADDIISQLSALTPDPAGQADNPQPGKESVMPNGPARPQKVNATPPASVKTGAGASTVSATPAAGELTFAHFRAVNEARASRWNKGVGNTLEFSMIELAGEVGEACNAAKKLARLRAGMNGGSDTTKNLAEELADVVICADLAAMKLGIDLGAAVAAKFNATSVKHGFPERLESSPASTERTTACSGFKSSVEQSPSSSATSSAQPSASDLNTDTSLEAMAREWWESESPSFTFPKGMRQLYVLLAAFARAALEKQQCGQQSSSAQSAQSAPSASSLKSSAHSPTSGDTGTTDTPELEPPEKVACRMIQLDEDQGNFVFSRPDETGHALAFKFVGSLGNNTVLYWLREYVCEAIRARDSHWQAKLAEKDAEIARLTQLAKEMLYQFNSGFKCSIGSIENVVETRVNTATLREWNTALDEAVEKIQSKGMQR